MASFWKMGVMKVNLEQISAKKEELKESRSRAAVSTQAHLGRAVHVVGD